MTTITTQHESQGLTLDAFASRDVTLADGGPAWLAERRREALAVFAELGLPTRRDEEWRFIDLRPIQQTRFDRAPDARDRVTAGDVDRLAIPDLDGPRLVFVNGRFAPDLSDLAAVPERVTVAPLAEALRDHEQAVRERLTQLAGFDAEAFTALNTAMIEDGAYVHVPRGVAVEQPIYALSITTAPDVAALTSPRTLIIAEESAEVTFIEDYVTLDEADVHLTNAVAEVYAGDNATVRHYYVEREGPQAFNISTLVSTQGRDSNVTSQSILLGGRIVRNNVNPILTGEGGHGLLNGLYVPTGSQTIDNHMRVEHRAPNCDSRQYYKGVISDDGHGIFTGRIVVSQAAQKTDAVQSNQNLLLSNRAKANAKPQLEIYADDVKCTHGATIGQLDAEAIFYLKSRGMSEEGAKGLLIYAFAAESLERIAIEPVRRFVERLLHERLPHVEPLEDVLD